MHCAGESDDQKVDNSRNYRWLVTLVRVLLGVIYVYAGVSKLIEPDGLAETVANYKIPPFGEEPLDMWLGYFLPVFEVLVGLALLLGVFVRSAALLSALMAIGFCAAVISVWVRGLNIECGCFGKQEVFEGYLVHVLLLILMFCGSLYVALLAGRSRKGEVA